MVRRPVPPLVNVGRAYFYTGAAQRFPFQVTSCGHFVVGEGFYTERDKREDYQLLHTLEGAGYLIVDGVRREIPAGSYVMIDCSRYHYYAVNGNHWVYDYVHLAGDGMKPFLDNAFTLPLLFFPSEDTMLNSYMSTILNTHIQDDIVGYSQACALGASILNEIVKECARSEQLNAKEIGEQGKRNIEGALLFMRCHYMETITLDDLVRETYMTKYHFCHRFKQITWNACHYLWVLILLGIILTVLIYRKWRNERQVQPEKLLPAVVFFVGTLVSAYSMVGSPAFPAWAWSSIAGFALITVGNLLHVVVGKCSLSPGRQAPIVALALAAVLISYHGISPELHRIHDMYASREIYIEEEKQAGNLDLEVPGIFTQCTYSSYSLFSELEQDDTHWPNTAIANYYDIHSISLAK